MFVKARVNLFAIFLILIFVQNIKSDCTTDSLCMSCPGTGSVCTICTGNAQKDMAGICRCQMGYMNLGTECSNFGIPGNPGPPITPIMPTCTGGCISCGMGNICNACPTSYYASSNTCLSCQVTHCNQCSAGGFGPICNHCATGYVLNSNDNTCGCASSAYEFLGSCVSCSSRVDNCNQCSAPAEINGNPTCTQCANTFIMTSDGSSCYCASGSYDLQGTCVSCSSTLENCSQCTSGDGSPTCSSCDTGYSLDNNSICQKDIVVTNTCKKDEVMVDGECQKKRYMGAVIGGVLGGSALIFIVTFILIKLEASRKASKMAKSPASSKYMMANPTSPTNAAETQV